MTETVDHPPRPRFTVRVGITGHRPNKLYGPIVETIEDQLSRVFKGIEEAASDLWKANAALYSTDTPQFRLLSNFAAGADQLAVSACPAGWLIEAILPFPKDEYLKDFSESVSGDNRDGRKEFLESLQKASSVTQLPLRNSERRTQGYLDAGSYLLRQVDLLVSVWDGMAPEPGGTGALVKEAHQGGIPVIWLSTVSNHVPRLITGFDERGAPLAPEANCTEGPLTSALKPIFDGPSSLVNYSRRPAQDAIRTFYGEIWLPCCRVPAYDLLARIATLKKPRLVIRARSFSDQCSDWDSFFKDAPAVSNLTERLRQVLLPRFVWSDALAVHYSHLYRSAYVSSYFLSAVAVFIALGGVFAVHIEQKALVVAAETLVIGVIIALIFFGRRRFWHERWLEYRALAESLRHGRFLAFLSEFGRGHGGPPGLTASTPSWTLWYLRATMRELNLPSAVLDATYRWRILSATVTNEIDKQIQYHQENRRTAHRIDHLLHNVGVFCFVATFFILAVFLVGYGYVLLLGESETAGDHPFTALGHIPFLLKPWMFICTAGLPALGAALTGIRAHGDFDASEHQSAQMISSLMTLKEDYTAALRQDSDLEDTAERLIAAARIMSEDLVAWEDLYGRKRLILPA
jgi:hypothetical protein